MAGTRVYKIGTIFTRTKGLLQSGGIPLSEKPIWYDVYMAFPPINEPKFDRPVPDQFIREILYPEDVIIAKFYLEFGSPQVSNIIENSPEKMLSQLFVEEYKNIGGSLDYSESIFNATVNAFRDRGIYLQKHGSPEVPQLKAVREAKPAKKPTIKLVDLFKKAHESEPS